MTDTVVAVQRPQIDPNAPCVHFGQTFQQVPAKLQRRNTKGSNNNNKCTNNESKAHKKKYEKKLQNRLQVQWKIQILDGIGGAMG